MEETDTINAVAMTHSVQGMSRLGYRGKDGAYGKGSQDRIQGRP